MRKLSWGQEVELITTWGCISVEVLGLGLGLEFRVIRVIRVGVKDGRH